jgi:hypothetical protein
MTLHSTLHAPTAGIRLVWPAAYTVVLDPGTSEQARIRNIGRERCLITLTIGLAFAAIAILRSSQPHDRPWPLAAVLLLTALAAAAARPGRRVVPASLVDVLAPLRGMVPSAPSEVQRLVWEASELIRTAEALDGAPGCGACAARVEAIKARLRMLAGAGAESLLVSSRRSA